MWPTKFTVNDEIIPSNVTSPRKLTVIIQIASVTRVLTPLI